MDDPSHSKGPSSHEPFAHLEHQGFEVMPRTGHDHQQVPWSIPRFASQRGLFFALLFNSSEIFRSQLRIWKEQTSTNGDLFARSCRTLRTTTSELCCVCGLIRVTPMKIRFLFLTWVVDFNRNYIQFQVVFLAIEIARNQEGINEECKSAIQQNREELLRNNAEIL